MPLSAHGLEPSTIIGAIELLMSAMVSIEDTTGQFVYTMPDGRKLDTKGWQAGWEWTQGIGLYGLWQYHELTGSAAALAHIEAWFAPRLASGAGTDKNINTMAVFLTLAHVYEETRNRIYLPWLDSWAEWAYHDLARTKFGGMQHVTYLSMHDQQLWDDTLMMTVLPLAKIGLVLGRPHYVAEAKRQFLLHVQYLSDRSTGLFFHGWQFHAEEDEATKGQGHNFACARWARGNSWVTMAIPELLDLLDLGPDSKDPTAGFLLNTLEAQLAPLKRLQRPSGLWGTLLDVPASEGSYPEASATAGFAYGTLKAIRKRMLKGVSTTTHQAYEDMAVKAIKAVLGNINPEGELVNTSFGTGMGDDLQHYKDIPVTTMPYGQAMAIMALVEYLRVFI